MMVPCSMKNRLLGKCVLWTASFLWMILIYSLSSQNGAETASLSSGIATITTEIVYENPEPLQYDAMHTTIRSLAHVGLFFILGILVHSANLVTIKRNILAGASSLGILVIFGYLDEWHKLFIEGRHFDLGEVGINVLSGVSGIAVVAVVFLMIANKMIKFPVVRLRV